MAGPPLRTVELPYRAESEDLFAPIADRTGAVFLDSGASGRSRGRFDILACEPRTWIESRDGRLRVQGAGTAQSADHPLELLRAALGPPAPAPRGLPFAGGAIGYFGYDLGMALEGLEPAPGPSAPLPELAVGIYDWALVVDHLRRRTVLVGESGPGPLPDAVQLLQAGAERPTEGGRFHLAGPVVSNLDRDAYAGRFARIQDYIRDGDCYQVNFAQRFTAPAEGDAWLLYRRLRDLSPAPFSAYLNTPSARILCSSPERFLRLRGRRVETWPIKGTRPRHCDPASDARVAGELRLSEKDRAENLMIVDLLRNDLGKVCTLGSIRVPILFEIRSYANVHHLVSGVSGHLAEGRDALDLLAACFPGGSVTGAPKHRAMQIIAELEPHRRGVYCGSIGYIGQDGAMDTNIAIRTMVHAEGLLSFWAGGGIVADSTAEAEYAESYDKASAMLRAAETFGR